MTDINVLLDGVEEFARLQPHMQLNTLRLFLCVAQRGTANQQDIEILLGLTSSGTTRNVAYWTDTKHGKGAGFSYMARTEDPRDRRSKLLRLTAEGKKFYEKLRAKKARGEI
jgi:DNA-binding MarR family transcriptional regulator